MYRRVLRIMKPKYYLQFFDIFDNKLHEGMGSDSVYVIDEKDVKNWHQIGQDRINSLKKVQKYVAFQLRFGTFTNYKNLSEVFFYEHTR